MRKIVYSACLLVLLFVSPVIASEKLETPHDYIARAIDSICKVEILDGEQTIGHGSGFVVKATPEETQIITAGHVLEGRTKCRVVLHGKSFVTSEFFLMDSTDGAMIFVRPGISFAKALQFNLSPDNSITKVNAFGYWGSAKIPGTPQMLSMQSGWVDRKVIDKFGAPDYKVVHGLIMGNVLIFPGDSGGPILDNEMRIVGINVILSKRHTLFVDSRYLWNNIAHLNQGKKVAIPYCFDYDILDTGSHKRIRLRDSDSLENEGDKTTFSDLRVLISADIAANGRIGYPGNFQPLPAEVVRGLFNHKTIVHIDGKKYLLGSVAIFAEGLKKWGYESPYASNYKYVYFVMHGAEIIIELAEFPEEDKQPTHDEKQGAFFRLLPNKHIKR